MKPSDSETASEGAGSLHRLVRALELGPENSAREWVGEVEERERETFVCCWFEHKHCTEEATHFHKAYGDLCPAHAAEVMMRHPKDKVRRVLVGVYRASDEEKRPNVKAQVPHGPGGTTQ